MTDVPEPGASPSAVTEDEALAMLGQGDCPTEQIEAIAGDHTLMKNRKVLRAVVAHPHTPRHVSLPKARHLYTFELMQIAMAPTVAADVKLFAEELLLNRLETITAGERLSLAKRASTRVAAALLGDDDARVMAAALENPRMTEAWVVRALQGATEALVRGVCGHAKWSLRREVQVALLRSPHLPATRAAVLAEMLPTVLLRDVVEVASEQVRDEIEKELERRGE